MYHRKPGFRPHRKHETILQEHFAHWLDAKGILFTASMAGVNLHPVVARLRKIMGCKPGTPDIMIFEPRGAYHGLFIELKSTEGDVKDPKQLEWQRELTKRKYLAVMMPLGLDFADAFNWLRDLVEKYMTNT